MYYPGSERVEACARNLGELADIYYHMPIRKDAFNNQDIEMIFEEVTKRVCSDCVRAEECWNRQRLRTYQKLYETLEQLEHCPERMLQDKMKTVCIHPDVLVQTIADCYHRERMRLYYTNRLLENREAVADQLKEMSKLLDNMVEDVMHTSELKDPVNKRICRLFARKGVEVERIFLMQKKGIGEVYITMRAKKGQIVSVKDLAGILSVSLHRSMIPARDARAMLSYEEETVLFVEKTKYHMGYGVCRVPKDGENISGDNFSYLQNDNGEVLMGLSDGMGSGAQAGNESTRLLELLEQFLESGVGEETAMKLINTTAVYERRSYSTLDVCTVDLHSGICQIRKLGAAPSFLYKEGEVVIIDPLRVPVGLFHNPELESSEIRLGDGDYIIMITDGVLDGIIGINKEEQFAGLIKEQMTRNPKTLASRLMDCVMEECAGEPKDDMTIYVAGIWENP